MSPECYAVLAQVSPGYSPLEGRLATCYSPVRHFTGAAVLLQPHFLVRLACVRHAASVDSEPGSNSRLKLAAFGRPESPPHANFWSFPLRVTEGEIVLPLIGNRTNRSACIRSQKTFCIDVACSTQLSKSSFTGQESGHPFEGVTMAHTTVHSEAVLMSEQFHSLPSISPPVNGEK
jgi:hypothetical protein